MDKKRFIVVGASSFGRECFALANAISKVRPKCPWIPFGFLDDRKDVLDGKAFQSFPILGRPESYEPGPEDLFIVGLGEPGPRAHYAQLLKDKGAKFQTLISPRAAISAGAKIGAGCMVSIFSLVSTDVTLGDHSFVSDHATLGHDVVVGRFSQIGSHVFVGGGVRIGDGVTLHPHATVLPRIVIEDGATIGAGSVVCRNVETGETVFGVPAAVVRI